jgi:hypothetical protein
VRLRRDQARGGSLLLPELRTHLSSVVPEAWRLVLSLVCLPGEQAPATLGVTKQEALVSEEYVSLGIEKPRLQLRSLAEGCDNYLRREKRPQSPLEIYTRSLDFYAGVIAAINLVRGACGDQRVPRSLADRLEVMQIEIKLFGLVDPGSLTR